MVPNGNPAGHTVEGKCHREHTAPKQGRLTAARFRVRVKRCGKSAPRPRRRGRQGKPHPEKVQIDVPRPRKGRAAGPAARFLTEPGRMGRTFEAARERGPRQMTVIRRKTGTRPGLQGPRTRIAPLRTL